jgi:hypothetical protein
MTILRQAAEVKMMEEYLSYIITSLDTHTIDFEDLKFMRANITTMRLIDPTSYDVTNGKIEFFLFLAIFILLRFFHSNSRLGTWRASSTEKLSNCA